jgi:N-acetylglucosamine kinase-like BadF-type ATPase
LTGSELPLVGLVGGGTTTECSVIDSSGAAIAGARRGPSNPNFVPLAEARANVTAALEAALHGIDRCRAAALALFEPVAPDGLDATVDVLAPLLNRTTTIPRYTEHEAALAACGIFETEGIAVVAGTGSSAAAMRDGKRSVAGGWGALLGDEGSAYDIAMWAIRAAIRSSDGTGPGISLLERRVTAHFGVATLTELVPLFYSNGVTRVEIADLCRVIAPDAAAEPAIAARFASAGDDLAALAVAAGRDVFDRNDTPAVAMSGGVWAAGDVIEGPFATAVRRAYPNARLARERSRPAVGLARRVMQEVSS